MSGCSDSTTCPNCRNNINMYTDWKPFDYVTLGPCVHCGFTSYATSKYISLKELNELRKEENEYKGFERGDDDYLEPLERVPERNKEYVWK